MSSRRGKAIANRLADRTGKDSFSPMRFCKVECVIKPFKLEALKDAMIEFGVTGMTVGEVMSSGPHEGPAITEIYRGAQFTPDLLPRLKVEMLLLQDQVREVMELIVQAVRTGNAGDGRITISPVESIRRIRNGDRDIDAL